MSWVDRAGGWPEGRAAASEARWLRLLTHRPSWPPASTSEDSWTDSEVDSSCSGQPIHLWQFLRELLLKPHSYGRLIRWLNKEKGEPRLRGRGLGTRGLRSCPSPPWVLTPSHLGGASAAPGSGWAPCSHLWDPVSPCPV